MKAVCVDDSFDRHYYLDATDTLLKVGRVYTIRLVACGPISGLHLNEIHRLPSHLHGFPLPYRFSRFRPLLGSEQSELDAIEEEVSETELIPA